tara:strand:- start:13 stop:555 length:543 start_codon:yes stop_codon:yes gene_type:complete
MIHAMIDLETLSTRPNATILTIGGVKFDPYSYAEPTQGMYYRIDVDSQTEMGRDVMEETVEWWGKQADDVREEALGDHDRIDLKYFIKQLNKWSVGVDVFWCQGPLFDYAILQNFYAQMNVPVPWNYWQIRDSRTLGSLVPRDNSEKRTGLHNALEDCYFQARTVQKIFHQLEIKDPSKY